MTGDTLAVPRCLVPRTCPAFAPFEVFFDGGTHLRGHHPSAGAGALLWHLRPGASPACIGRAAMAIPGLTSAPLAESHACGLALMLLAEYSETRAMGIGQLLRARVIGDCVPVVRYGAAQARFRCLAQRAPIDEGLERAGRRGWRLGWQAVGRAQNKAAHEVASSAASWASSLVHAGQVHPRVLIEWRGGATATASHYGWPPWP